MIRSAGGMPRGTLGSCLRASRKTVTAKSLAGSAHRGRLPPRMYRAALISLVLSSVALAYEGAGIRHVEDAGVVQPKLTKAPVLTKFVSATLDGGVRDGA